MKYKYFQLEKIEDTSFRGWHWGYNLLTGAGYIKDEDICYTCEKLSDIQDYIKESLESDWDISGYIFAVKAIKAKAKAKGGRHA